VRVNAPTDSSSSINNTTLSGLSITDATGSYSYGLDLVTGTTNLGTLLIPAAKESYLFIRGIQGDFTVSGQFNFSWTGGTSISQMPGGNSGFIKEFKGFTTVPGPLPVLGLAAAFGWSRKLRKRIQKKDSFPA
jgi:hypothetical protein